MCLASAGQPCGPSSAPGSPRLPSEFSATWGSGPGQPVGAPPRDRATGPRNMTNCSVSTLGPLHALRVPTGRGWLGSVDSGYLSLQGCSFPGAKRCPHCSEGATVPCAWYLPHPEASLPRRQRPGLPLAEGGCGSGRRGGALLEGAGPWRPRGWRWDPLPSKHPAHCGSWALRGQLLGSVVVTGHQRPPGSGLFPQPPWGQPEAPGCCGREFQLELKSGGRRAFLSLLGLVASTPSLTPFPTGPSAARATPVSHPGQN